MLIIRRNWQKRTLSSIIKELSDSIEILNDKADMQQVI